MATKQKAGRKAAVPVLVGRWSEDAERKILLTLDPIASEFVPDREAMERLMESVSFSSEALNDIVKGLGDLLPAPAPTSGKTDPDAVPPTPVDPITKPGDLWLLGEHRLLCGDATKAEDVERLMGGQKADVCLTDPPYGIGLDYESHDDSDNHANEQLVKRALALGPERRVWTCGMRNLRRDLLWNPNAKVLCWFKHFSRSGNGFGGASTWEPVLVVGSASNALKNDHLAFVTDRWEGLHKEHPCPKPVALLVELVTAFCDAVAYDPFSGSGTTLVACEQLGRRCFALEIEPKYCDVSVRRWEEFTGRKAERTTA